MLKWIINITPKLLLIEISLPTLHVHVLNGQWTHVVGPINVLEVLVVNLQPPHVGLPTPTTLIVFLIMVPLEIAQTTC
jgi:hypothetical protein